MAIWVRKTLLELTASIIFYELQVNGPLVTIGPGLGLGGSNYIYPVSMFLNSGDDYTLMEDPVIFLSNTMAASVGLVGAGAQTSTIVGYPMDYMNPKAIQPLLFISGGVPFKYTRFGPNFWFGSQPGQPYQVYLPYQIRHPFNDSNLQASPLFIPQDWEDVVEYAAAERGAISQRWPDMSNYLHSILYGDPKKPDTPGLISARKAQIDRDSNKSTRQLIPVCQRY